MRANTTIVVELPVDWDDFVDQVNAVTSLLDERRMWRATIIQPSAIEGGLPTLSITIGGRVVSD